MVFKEAFALMKQGTKVKLPSWGGYWRWDADKETIMMHCRPQLPEEHHGDILDIRDTDRVEYTLTNILSDEWTIVEEENTPVLDDKCLGRWVSGHWEY